MKNSGSRTEGYQANGLHEATLNNKGTGTIGATTPLPSKSINSDPETPSDSVNERDQAIQEEKIHDISEENDTMHNPEMELGKSYTVTTEDDEKIDTPDENPNKEYDYDDDKVRKSNVVA